MGPVAKLGLSPLGDSNDGLRLIGELKQLSLSLSKFVCANVAVVRVENSVARLSHCILFDLVRLMESKFVSSMSLKSGRWARWMLLRGKRLETRASNLVCCSFAAAVVGSGQRVCADQVVNWKQERQTNK